MFFNITLTQVYGEKSGDSKNCVPLTGTDLGAPKQQENCYFDRVTGKKLKTKGSLEFANLSDAAKACLPGKTLLIVRLVFLIIITFPTGYPHFLLNTLSLFTGLYRQLIYTIKEMKIINKRM